MASMPTPAEIEYQMTHAPDNRVSQLIAVNAVCFTIACTAVVLRFIARRMARVDYGADDCLVVIGLVSNIPLFAIISNVVASRY